MTDISSAGTAQLAGAGASALRRNDPLAARTAFEQLVALRPSDPDAWIGLALAIRALGDNEAAQAAVDRVLGAHPSHWRALLMKADHFAMAGDGRAAHTFYRASVARAPAIETQTAEIRSEIRRAQRQIVHYSKSYEDHLIETLSRSGFDAARSSRRFVQALDLLFGKKKIYSQSPTSFYFPELPQRQFYEREEFPWLAELEARTEIIRNEFLSVIGDERGFGPYVRSDPDRPQREYGRLLDNLDWSAFFLIEYGRLVAENASRCPQTLASVEGIPLCRSPARAPSVFFSVLRPGVRIPPHTGFTNARLIVHLPLIIPEGCALRVGNEVRPWTPGQALIFDDSVEHEAWNESRELRAVLILEIWRPELTEEERDLVATLLAAVNSYSAG